MSNSVKNISRLSQVAGKLQERGLSPDANEGWNQASRAMDISNDELRQAMLFASISKAHQQLGRQYEESKEKEDAKTQWEQAAETLKESVKRLPPKENMDVPEQWATLVHVKRVQGSFFKEQKNIQDALTAYKEAFDTLKKASSTLQKFDTNIEIIIYDEFLPEKQKILSANAIENLHREFIALLSESSNPNKQQKIREVRESLQAHLFAELNYLMKVRNWKGADQKNAVLMLNIAGIEKRGYLDTSDIEKFPCPALRAIDKLWVKHSEGKFGFSVQKDILDSVSKQPGHYDNINEETWGNWVSRVGWQGSDTNYNLNQAEPGHLPRKEGVDMGGFGRLWRGFFSLSATCRL
ncbi:GUN4 domain-containing protein [Allocoleopsis franciscana]|uniref:GUN4 protein n=1 Tax=Allocoleopsis franciscana PCC 7113 TaxID=1173027 RepID=K9WIR0_9CYAN|nr:GUN4 domain-containing protein [Allocoleopsis franciscana]AFZ19654.1 GUN4 protein [Allocoleopsis franciscana PCC 7113]